MQCFNFNFRATCLATHCDSCTKIEISEVFTLNNGLVRGNLSTTNQRTENSESFDSFVVRSNCYLHSTCYKAAKCSKVPVKELDKPVIPLIV